MEKIMNKPKWLQMEEDGDMIYGKKHNINFWDGDMVKNKFYNRSVGYGSLREDRIPDELKKKYWVPDKHKLYKCWWFYTNPSDPADPGEDILSYIEEVDVIKYVDMRKDVIRRINEKMEGMRFDDLKGLEKYVSRF